MSGGYARMLDGLVEKRERKLKEGAIRKKIEDVEGEYERDFPGQTIDCQVIVFGVRRAVSVSVLYSICTLCLIVLCVVLGIEFGIPQQVIVFAGIIVAFLALVVILARKAWTDAGYALCSEQFIGVYHLFQKRYAETTPSRIRRVEIGKRYLMVTCAQPEEDFRMTRTDNRYLEFCKFLERCGVEAVDHLDFEKIDEYLGTR